MFLFFFETSVPAGSKYIQEIHWILLISHNGSIMQNSIQNKKRTLGHHFQFLLYWQKLVQNEEQFHFLQIEEDFIVYFGIVGNISAVWGRSGHFKINVLGLTKGIFSFCIKSRCWFTADTTCFYKYGPYLLFQVVNGDICLLERQLLSQSKQASK